MYAGDPDVIGAGFIGPLLPGTLVQGPTGQVGIFEPSYLPGQKNYYGNPYLDPNAAIDRLLAGQATGYTAPPAPISITATNARLGNSSGSPSGLLLLGALGLGAILLMRRR